MGLVVHSRRSWRAERPRSTPTRVSWHGKNLFVHHTATPFRYTASTTRGRMREERAYMRLLQQIAFGRGFADISYNYVVFPSGRVYAGRGAQIKGAHTQGGKFGYAPFYNDHPGVAFPGDYNARRLTRAQVLAYYALRRRLRARTGISTRQWPHRKVFATACPGNHVMRQLGLRG